MTRMHFEEKQRKARMLPFEIFETIIDRRLSYGKFIREDHKREQTDIFEKGILALLKQKKLLFKPIELPDLHNNDSAIRGNVGTVQWYPSESGQTRGRSRAESAMD